MHTKSKTHSSKSAKRILSVTIKKMVDECPDTSWLGEYSNSPASKFSIDRAHSEDCASLQPISGDGLRILESAVSYLESVRVVCEDHIQVSAADCERCEQEIADQKAIDTLTELQDEPECDCNGGDMGRHEFRYFNASFNYVGKDGKPTDGLSPEEVRKYVRQDYERMEGLNAGDWCFVGIRAEAEIVVIENVISGPPRFPITPQTITSGGLWGIESDSDRAFSESVEKDELADLRTQLLAFGFTSRAISTAFKSVERKDA